MADLFDRLRAQVERSTAPIDPAEIRQVRRRGRSRLLNGAAAAVILLVAAALVAARLDHDDAEVGRGPGPQRYEASVIVLEDQSHGPELCVIVLTSLPPQCDGLPVTNWSWSDVGAELDATGYASGSYHVVGTYHDGRFTLTEVPGPAGSMPDLTEDRDFSPACDNPEVDDPAQGEAEWEAMSQDYGPFEIPGLVTAWVSDPGNDGHGSFVGNVVVVPGNHAAALAKVREHYGGPVCIVERDAPTEARLATVQEELVDDDARAVLGIVVAASPEGDRGVVSAHIWVADDAAQAYVAERWGGLVELRGVLQPVP